MERFDPFDRRMPDEVFEEYLLICKELYLDMLRSGEWPWPEDSSISENLLESKDS